MYEKGVILLDNWQKGVADSPYLGNASIVGCNIFETPGVLKIENATASYVTVTGLPIARVKTPAGDDFILTDDGKFYKNGTAIQTGLTNPSDMIQYKDYILVTSSTVIHAYGPLSASPVFTSNWKTGLSSYYHKLVIANDLSTSTSADAVYITNGNTIAKITSFTNGAAGAPPATGTLTTTVLTLPDGKYASTMALLGNKLMIGTYTTGVRVADIYPWDKLTTHSYDNPISLNEIGVNSLLSDGNKMYISAGNHGNIYVTDGANYRFLKRIPFSTRRNFGYTMTTYPNAMAMHSNGSLLVGTSTSSSNSATVAKHGVWEINVTMQNNPCALKCIISSGTVTGTNGILKIGVVSMLGSDDSIYIGWMSGSTYGFDSTGSSYYTSYTAQAETGLMIIADQLTPRTFKNLEFKLGSPLTTGQGIKVEYRKHLSDTYRTLGTYTYSTLGGVISHNAPALMADVEQAQIRVSLTTPVPTVFGNELELEYIKIW